MKKNEAPDVVDSIKESIRMNSKRMRLSSAFSDKAFEIGSRENLVFLNEILNSEAARRQTQKIDKLSVSGGFPMRYGVDQFDTTNVQFPEGESLESLLQLPFLRSTPRRNVIMVGRPGSGMTMLSIILGETACDQGYSTRFMRTSDLVTLLDREGTLGAAKTLDKTQLLILDEFGYVPYTLTSSRLLFDLISSFVGKKSIILNTCLEFSKWIEVLGDEQHLGSSFAGKMADNSYLILLSGKDRRFTTMHTKKNP